MDGDRWTTVGRADSYAKTGLARRSPGVGVSDHGAGQIDTQALRRYRLGRVQAELKARDIPAILLCDPVNQRYATGVRNMQPWALHSTFRASLVPAEGKAIAFEYAGSQHLAESLETIAEVRRATPLFGAGAESVGQPADPRIDRWAKEMAALVREIAGDRPRLAIDRHLDHFSARALEAEGVELLAGQKLMSRAQAIKSAEEVACISVAIAVAETAMHRLREALEPGMTEIDLWAILEQTNVAYGGEYMDTRLLSSGGRTNPWYQEATDRIVRPGELVAFDTDMVGPFGYDADISRTYFCPPGRPSDAQRRLYGLAFEKLHHNLELVRPGASFREMSEAAYLLPEEFQAQAMAMVWHGVGLYGQWPTILGRGFFDDEAEDGIVEPGMVLCCEAYVGAKGGLEGVKLEQQLLVTETGYELLTLFPFEEALLGRPL